MFSPGMELFVLVVTILPCLCFDPPTGNVVMWPFGTYSVQADTTVMLNCSVEGGNPLATLTWQCKGSTFVGQNLSYLTTSDSRLELKVDKTYHQQNCLCTARQQASPNGWVGTMSVQFNVLYAPDVDTFIIQSEPVYEGQTLNMYCKMQGGNPLATLTWSCVNQPNVASYNISIPTDAVWKLEITSINRSYNGMRCTCTATHKEFAQRLNKYNSIIVYYPPTGSVVMSPSGTYNVQTGITVTLECRVEGGNPLATLRWQCKRSTVEGQNLTNETTAASRLILNVDRTFHQQQCVCLAGHQASPNGQFGRKSVQFNILYKPIITLDSSTAYINESVDFRRICKAESNPSPSVAWYRGTTFKQSNGILSIPRIDRTDAASYVCAATAGSTAILKSTERFMLVVQYGPDVNLTITNTTENATNVRLVCTANGVPPQYTYRWKHMLGSTVIRDTFDQVTSSGSVSTLTIPRVTYEVMGTYVCEVNNGYRGRDGQIAQTRQDFLYVRGRPRAISVQNTYVTDKGTSLDINITYISFPEALNTSILRGSSALPPKGELSVTVSSVPVTVLFFNKNVSIDGYIVQLHFSTFETRHQGRYQLYVWNEYTYYYDFEIIISDKPDHPTGLVIDQITKSSAVVSWTPGEDNGNIQTFTLTCQENNGEFHTNITLNYTISSLTVENLDISTEYDVTVYARNAMGTSESITSTFNTISVAVTLSGSSEYAVPGNDFTLTCDVPDEANSVQLYRRPDVFLPVGSLQVALGQCYNTLTTPVQCGPNVCSCIANSTLYGTVFQWVIQPRTGDHGSVWFCRRTNPNLPVSVEESPDYTLNVADLNNSLSVHFGYNLDFWI
ncbi:nephrin-like [Mizuhopecten yessoensis]|uniref:nephrin-like n=1 Tax=Mizuhopecten yessoensis TaxID=6573 RepID=UPI000B45C291|nr:nephrin-like [Mizuhopecten yessoensis]